MNTGLVSIGNNVIESGYLLPEIMILKTLLSSQGRYILYEISRYIFCQQVLSTLLSLCLIGHQKCQLTGLALTERQLLPRVWWQCEPEHSHRRNEDARHDQVEEVVERSPADPDDECDVQIGLRAAVVEHLVALAGDT